MAYVGQTIHNPQTGETITFLQTAAESNGKLLRLECCVASGRGLKIPPHMHPIQEQHFLVKKGKMRFWLAREERLLRPGDRMTVPMRKFYNWRAEGLEELCFEAEYEPAGHWEDIFESTFELARRAAAGKRYFQLLAGAVMMTHFKDHLVIAGPPLFVQRAMFSILAVVGRAMGYQPIYHYTES